MPLPPSEPRSSMHNRRIHCEGFRREDGLWDIDAHLVDTRGYDIELETAPNGLQAGDALHEMWMRVTLDNKAEIQDVYAEFNANPFFACPKIAAAYKQLVGMKIRPGWRRRVLEKLGGTRGCTHLTELLNPIATVAFQTIAPILARENKIKSTTKPLPVDSCHALIESGSVVKEHYPDWYKPNKPDNA